MMIGLAKSGARTWDIAMKVDVGSIADTTSSPAGPQRIR
jgi:hypothetical protein